MKLCEKLGVYVGRLILSGGEGGLKPLLGALVRSDLLDVSAVFHFGKVRLNSSDLSVLKGSNSGVVALLSRVNGLSLEIIFNSYESDILFSGGLSLRNCVNERRKLLYRAGIFCRIHDKQRGNADSYKSCDQKHYAYFLSILHIFSPSLKNVQLIINILIYSIITSMRAHFN